MKYRKKPVVIEAEVWDGSYDNTLGVVEYLGNKIGQGYGWINTLEGGHIVTPGDYIITGIKGERYPCKPDIFALTYEAVEGELV